MRRDDDVTLASGILLNRWRPSSEGTRTHSELVLYAVAVRIHGDQRLMSLYNAPVEKTEALLRAYRRHWEGKGPEEGKSSVLWEKSPIL